MTSELPVCCEDLRVLGGPAAVQRDVVILWIGGGPAASGPGCSVGLTWTNDLEEGSSLALEVCGSLQDWLELISDKR